ncbi:MAG: hypothetical protein HYV13_00800 [Candidatus Doudnabacteria bacterium]|nr:hypothetical protein [Candidatus Doudnabacteria bacterium]
MNDLSENKSKRSEIAKVILGCIAAAGVIAIPVAGPLILMAIAEELNIPKWHRRKVYLSLRNLEQRKLIGISKEDGKTVVRLTKNGQNKFLKYKLEELHIKKPAKWDKLWRAVIFDIPEKYKQGRESMRAKLRELGFYRLQKSVWVYPYACEDEIDFISELYEVRPFVRIMLVKSIDIQKDLIKQFGL